MWRIEIGRLKIVWTSLVNLWFANNYWSEWLNNKFYLVAKSGIITGQRFRWAPNRPYLHIGSGHPFGLLWHWWPPFWRSLVPCCQYLMQNEHFGQRKFENLNLTKIKIFGYSTMVNSNFWVSGLILKFWKWHCEGQWIQNRFKI